MKHKTDLNHLGASDLDKGMEAVQARSKALHVAIPMIFGDEISAIVGTEANQTVHLEIIRDEMVEDRNEIENTGAVTAEIATMALETKVAPLVNGASEVDVAENSMTWMTIQSIREADVENETTITPHHIRMMTSPITITR